MALLWDLLPKETLLEVLSEWIDAPSLARFDSAHCSALLRPLFLSLIADQYLVLPGVPHYLHKDESNNNNNNNNNCNSHSSKTKNSYKTNELYLRWLGLRRIKVRTLSMRLSLRLSLHEKVSLVQSVDYREVSQLRCERVLTRDSAETVGRECQKLTSLQLMHQTTITDQSLSYFVRNCELLTVLNLNNCAAITDTTVVAFVQSNRRLQEVSISGCREMTDYSMDALANSCPQLLCLNVSFCRNISDEGISCVVRGCPSLEKLSVRRCTRISDTTLHSVSLYGKNLTYLGINYFSFGILHSR